jgi:hypothetical protein
VVPAHVVNQTLPHIQQDLVKLLLLSLPSTLDAMQVRYSNPALAVQLGIVWSFSHQVPECHAKKKVRICFLFVMGRSHLIPAKARSWPCLVASGEYEFIAPLNNPL